MIRLKVNLENERVALRGLDELEGNTRFAAAMALTKTAKLGQKAAIEEMKATFDRPTPYTLNSTFTKPATKRDLSTFVAFREFGGKGNPASRFIYPEVFGGKRREKRAERSLQSASLLPGGRATAPGAGAKLDRYGNMSRGQIVKILSYLRASSDATQNRNAEGTSKGRRRKDSYFAISGRSTLAPGVYMRVGRGGRGYKPVLNFIDLPSYTPRFRFHEVVSQAVEEDFPAQFREALKRAIPK